MSGPCDRRPRSARFWTPLPHFTPPLFGCMGTWRRVAAAGIRTRVRRGPQRPWAPCAVVRTRVTAVFAGRRCGRVHRVFCRCPAGACGCVQCALSFWWGFKAGNPFWRPKRPCARTCCCVRRRQRRTPSNPLSAAFSASFLAVCGNVAVVVARHQRRIFVLGEFAFF